MLKLQACTNVPASTLPFMHIPLLIMVRHSRAFLLMQFFIYLSCHILVIYSHSYEVILPTLTYIFYPRFRVTSGIAIFPCDD